MNYRYLTQFIFNWRHNMIRQDTQLLQHWMKEVITTQGSMQYKLQRARQMHQLNEVDVVAATRDISIYSRIQVYTSGYVMRLFECICADFPVLQQFMGDAVFDQFAKASLLWSPSTSYSLYDLGTTFISFLEATRPKHLAVEDEQGAFLHLPVEIARAERARSEALRAKGAEDAGNLNAEIFPEQILFSAHQITLVAPECLRLVVLKFPLKQLFEQAQKGEPMEIPEPAESFVAISRMNYRPTMEELEEWQFCLLKACETPVTLTHALHEAAAVTGIAYATLMAEACIWLPVLQQKGFLMITVEGGGLF